MMNQDQDLSQQSLNTREAKLDSRERELERLEASLKKQTTAQAKKQGPEADLDRKIKLNKPEGKVDFKKLGVLFFSFGVVAAVLWIFNHNNQDSQAQPEEKFEITNRRAPTIPPQPLVLPDKPAVPDKSEEDQKWEALLEERAKSPMLVYSIKGKNRNQAKPTSGTWNSEDPNQQFQQALQNVSVPVSQAIPLGNLATRILQGKVIDATLETAVNSDLPGMVRAMVSYDVYGESGRQVLIPKGSRLVGQYNSSVRKGQARVFVVWNRVVTPQGFEVALHSTGTDTLGRAGIKGRVNNHFWQIFGTSALLSVIGTGAGTAGVSTSDEYNSLAAYRDEVAGSFRDSASQVLDRYIDIPPTIKIKQGASIKVLVARDLDFSQSLKRSYPTTNSQQAWVIRP